MALILRTCILASKRHCLKELTSLNKVTSPTYINNIKASIGVLHVKQFSSEDHENPTDKRLIYRGVLSNQIRNIKTLTLTTSVMGIACQPILFLKLVEVDNVGLFGISAAVTFYTVLSPLIIHFITKKYVTNIYYVPKGKKYIAEIYNIFVRPVQIEFTPDDVVIPDISGMFQTCIIKGTPLFFDERHFTEYGHYVRIMGYDKPIDFKLSKVKHEASVLENEEVKSNSKIKE